MKNEENSMERLVEMLSDLIIKYTKEAIKGEEQSC